HEWDDGPPDQKLVVRLKTAAKCRNQQERPRKRQHQKNRSVEIQRPGVAVHLGYKTSHIVIHEKLVNKGVAVQPGAGDVPWGCDSQCDKSTLGMPVPPLPPLPSTETESQQCQRRQDCGNRPLR